MSLWYSFPSLTHVTLIGNAASHDGGGMYLIDSSPTITNSIIAYNAGSYNVDAYSSNSTTFTYSSLYDPNGNNIDGLTLDSTSLIGEPGLLEPPSWDEDSGMWVFTDLHLALDSPLINAGDPNLYPAGQQWLRPGRLSFRHRHLRRPRSRRPGPGWGWLV